MDSAWPKISPNRTIKIDPISQFAVLFEKKLQKVSCNNEHLS